jgi:hypothetical protein
LVAAARRARYPLQVQWSSFCGGSAGAIERLCYGVRQLLKHGWPPTAITLFDEAWLIGADAAALMLATNGSSPVMDTLGFLVDPATGDKGFSPHRDRQPDDWTSRGLPEDIRQTFRPDGTAKYATVWIALSQATPANSCLHFLPASHDPGYYSGDIDDGPHHAGECRRSPQQLGGVAPAAAQPLPPPHPLSSQSTR